MGRRQSVLCLAILAAGLALGAPANSSPNQDLHALMSDYDAFARAQDPIRAGQRGDLSAIARWPDHTPPAIAARKSALDGFSARAAALASAPLSEGDRIERDILVERLKDALEGLSFNEERVPFVSGEGFFTETEFAGTQMALTGLAAAEAWLQKIDALPAYYAAEIANMRRGIATRFTQPRLVAEAALAAARAQADAPPEKSSLLLPLAKLPGTIPAAKRAELAARGLALVRTRVKPAQRALVQFFQTEYLPAARPALGAGTLPGGEKYYAYLVRHHTTTDLTPQAIHELGLKEVARIRAEMDKIIKETGFKGSFKEFLAYLRSDPRFYPKDAEDLLNKTSEIANRINGELPRWIGHLPRLTYAVVFIPPSIESSSAGYLPGSAKLGVAGQVLLTRTGAERRTLYDLPAWVAHEGAPGHHTQIALADELEGLPDYRRNDDVTAFVEGWALYSERLGDEMGLYRDPYERFGQLSMEMWRACRLVIDTGIHAMGWTRDQAVACLRENSALGDFLVDKEVNRYIGWPGQALAYKIGALQILELRETARAKLGACFNIRAFHDAVLGSGAVPLSVLRRSIQSWTAARACPATAR